MDSFSFGEWLRQRRSALLLSREDLAQRVGCAVVTLRKIEADERRPSLAVAERLADLLELRTDERTLFIQVARGLATADRLPVPIPRGAAPPTPSASPAAPTAAPSGTVTFLFTDIEGSSRLWEQYPQAMPAALARHDSLLQQQIAAHGGQVFKTMGDAVCAAFATAPDALSAALASQHALHAEEWGALGALRVRMALHSGVAEEREGDYFGPTLNRVARLLSAGHGGQTLLSAAASELIRDHLPSDVGLRDLGEHRLKDLTRPEQIFQLVVPDLPADFPPLKTLEVQRTNLPAQPTALIGRAQEVAAVAALLRRADVRLVTLSGPGGVGKTRLALQVAADLLDEHPRPLPSQSETAPQDAGRFPDGVWFVNLAPISEPERADLAIAQALDVREGGDQPIGERLKDYLREKRLLLLLDNFEQIVEAAPLVGELLAIAPRLSVLITSRIALRLSGEREFGVPPLQLPDRAHLPPLDRLTQYDAVRLFIERAQAVKADFAVTNENAPVVAEICERLDGLPLALELAAARIKLFPPQALLMRLSNRMTFLKGGARDLPARQQTIRDTIEWSYQLLDAGEQRLFARLGVFVGGCTLEAAEAVCNADGALPIEVGDGIEALLDNSLLRQTGDGESEPHVVMLETIREYALHRLEQRGEAEAIRHVHLDYYLQLAEQAKPMLRQTEQLVSVDRLSADYDNLRAALLWGAAGAAPDAAGRMAAALLYYWRFKETIGDGRQLVNAVLAGSSRLSLPVRAQTLLTAGFLAGWYAGGYQAEAIGNQCLALYRELDDRYGILHSLLLLGLSLLQQQHGRARPILEQALVQCRELGDRDVLGDVLIYLGRAEAATGETASAMAHLEEGLLLGRERGDRLLITLALRGQAYLAVLLRDFERAQRLLEECLSLRRELGGNVDIGLVLNSLGELARLQNDYERAAMFYEECGRLSREAGGMNIAYVVNLGYIALERHNYEQARDLFATYIHSELGRGMRAALPVAIAGLAGVDSGLGQAERAARLLGASEALNSARGSTFDLVNQIEYDRILEQVRAQLDEATFEAAWAEGCAMSLDQAIAEALSGGG